MKSCSITRADASVPWGWCYGAMRKNAEQAKKAKEQQKELQDLWKYIDRQAALAKSLG